MKHYSFSTSSDGTIYAITHYMGKSIRGKAKCDPADMPNEEFGKELALARCNIKFYTTRQKALMAKMSLKREIIENLIRDYQEAAVALKLCEVQREASIEKENMLLNIAHKFSVPKKGK